MTPFAFLKEELASVREALNETLRYDYGPQLSLDYFNECNARLDLINQYIEDDSEMDGATIAAHMRSLGALGSRISLIERSHLGEFSWPFAEIIRHFAAKVFVERQMSGTYPPIVHVTAEGMQYQIVNDSVPPSGDRRIIIVAFPRQLKHQVLLHSIFGHELGHTAFLSDSTGKIIRTEVLPALNRRGPLRDQIQATTWMQKANAEKTIASFLKDKPKFMFAETALINWRMEIICDLFGLLLFGPSFAAAHRTILAPLATTFDFDLNKSSHPPYSIRRHVVASAMKVLGWDKPTTLQDDGAIYIAEKSFLEYASQNDSDEWSKQLLDEQLSDVIDKIKKIFEPYPDVAFSKPTRPLVVELINRLGLGRPPIMQSVDNYGTPTNASVPACHLLYAGWSFWFGRKEIRESKLAEQPQLPELDFLKINRLCEYAMLQQHAIDLTLSP